MKYLKLLLILIIALGMGSCGDSVVESIQNDTGPIIPVNHAPVIEGIQSDLGALDIIPHMKIALTVLASDPDGDPVLYSFTTEQGSFNNLVDTGEGCTIDFYAAGVIHPDEKISVTVNVADAEGASASMPYDVGVGLRAPEFNSGADFVDPDSVVLIGAGENKYLRANEPAIIEFLTNSAGRYQVQVTTDPGVTSVAWDDGTPSYPYSGSSVVTVYIYGADYGLPPKLMAEVFNRVFIVIKGDTGEACKYSDLYFDGNAPTVTLTGHIPAALSPGSYVLLQDTDNGGPYVQLSQINISTSDVVEMRGGQIIYTTNGSDPQFGSGSPSVIDVPANATIPYTAYINLSSLTSGTYTVKYRARDKVGNVSLINYITYSVDFSGPGITLYPAPVAAIYVYDNITPSYNLDWSADKEVTDYIIFAVAISEVYNSTKRYDDYTTPYTLLTGADLAARTHVNYTIDTDTCTALAAGQGQYRIIVQATSQNDLSSVNGQLVIIWDDTPPVSSISVNPLGSIVSGCFPNCGDKVFTVTITDIHSGVDIDSAEMNLEETATPGDVILPLTPTGVSGNDYYFSFDPCDISGSYEDESLTVRVTAVDNALNSDNIVTYPFDFDNVRPNAATFSTAEPSPTKSGSFDATLTFDEEVDAVGLTSGDFTLVNCSIPVAGITPSSGFSNTFTVTIAPGNDGDVTASIKANAANDNAGNPNSVTAGSLVMVYDDTPPVANNLTTTVTSPTNLSKFNATLTFSEDVSVTNLTSGGFMVSNCSITNITAVSPVGGYDNTFTIEITPSGNATLTVAVNTDATNDPAGNLNTVTASVLTRLHDSIAPDADSLAQTLPTTANPTNASLVYARLRFSEDVNVASLTSADFTVSNCSITNIAAVSPVSGYDDEFTITIDPTAHGDVSVTVKPFPPATTDKAGNSSTVSAGTLTFLYDIQPPRTSPPAVSITTDPAVLSGNPINVTKEPVLEFTITDQTSPDVQSYWYKLDSSPTWTNKATIAEKFSIDLTSATHANDGNHTVYVKACDALGNCQDNADAATFSWKLDTTAPVPDISSPVKVTGSGNVYLSYVKGQIKIDFSATDTGGSGIKGGTYTVSFGGTAVDTYSLPDVSDPSDQSFVYSTYMASTGGRFFNTTSYNGDLTVTLVVEDDAGNICTTETLVVIADNTPPVVTFLDPVDNFPKSPDTNFLYVVGNSNNVRVNIADSGSGLGTVGTDVFTLTFDVSDNDYPPTGVTGGPIYVSSFSITGITSIIGTEGDGATGVLSVEVEDHLGNIADLPETCPIQICRTWSKGFGTDGSTTNDSVKSVIRGKSINLIAAGQQDGKIEVKSYKTDNGDAGSSPGWRLNPAFDQNGCANSVIGSYYNYYLAAGKKGESTYYPWLIRINSADGTRNWDKTFDTIPAMGLGEAFAVCEQLTSTNSIVKYVVAGAKDGKWWIGSIDKDGTPATEKDVKNDSYTGVINSIEICKTGGTFEGFIIAGKKDNKPYVATVNDDATFTIKDDVELSTSDGVAYKIVNSGNNTDYYVAGATVVTGSEKDGWIKKITVDIDTGVCSSTSVGSNLIDKPLRAICKVTNTRYLLAGSDISDGVKAWIGSRFVNTGNDAWSRTLSLYAYPVNSITDTIDNNYSGIFLGGSAIVKKLSPDGDE